MRTVHIPTAFFFPWALFTSSHINIISVGIISVGIIKYMSEDLIDYTRSFITTSPCKFMLSYIVLTL